MATRRWNRALVAALAVMALAGVGAAPGVPRAASATDFPVLYFADRWPFDPVEFHGHARPIGFSFWGEHLAPEMRGWSVRATSSTDPAGIVVPAQRDSRASSYYAGSFQVGTSSDQRGQRLAVADGDTIRLVYHDPNPPQGAPRQHSATATWRAVSSPPDRRELTYTVETFQQARLLGSRGAIPGGATVRVYRDHHAGALLLATATAAPDGTVDVPFTGFDAPAKVWASSEEPGLGETSRIAVDRAAFAGRIVAPEASAGSGGVHSTLVDILPAGERAPWLAGGISDHGGRFSTTALAHRVDGQVDVHFTLQSDQDAVPGADWPVYSYGTPTPVRSEPTRDVRTQDLGDVAMLAPNVVGHVVDGQGVDVAEAWVRVPFSGGEHNAYSRPDGRFALHLPDGTHRMTVAPPYGCAGGQEQTVTVRIAGGVASPAAPRFVLDTGSPAPGEPAAMPVRAPADGTPVVVEVDAPGGTVAMELTDPVGRGVVSAACPGERLARPDVNLVNDGIDLDTGALRFGAAEVCLTYTDQRVRAAGVRESALQVLHWPDGGRPQAVTTSHDTRRNVICGRTTSFSPFAVGVRLPTPRLSAAPATASVLAGGSVAVSGALLDRSSGAPLANARVVVSARRAGTSSWSPLRTVRTDERGRFATTHAPTANTEYRARFEGNRRYAPAAVRTTRVTLRPRVTAGLSSTSVRFGATPTVSGRVEPSSPRQTVQLQRLANGQWKAVASQQLSASSTYRFTVRPSARGTHDYRVIKPATAVHGQGVSAVRRLTVR